MFSCLDCHDKKSIVFNFLCIDTIYVFFIWKSVKVFDFSLKIASCKFFDLYVDALACYMKKVDILKVERNQMDFR